MTDSECRWLLGPHPAPALTRFGERPLFREGLYQLRQGCYAWMVPNGSWGETNIGLIDCGGESVLIDTCWDVTLTQNMLSHLQPLLKTSPVEYLINTHADGDHCWGNQLFAAKPIIATHGAVASMHHYSPVSLRALSGAGRILKRLPLGSLRLFGHYMSGMFAPYDFSDVSLTPPNTTFSGEKTLTVGGVEIVLMEVGPGHTDGDAFVWVPGRSVLYAGDVLFVGVTPVMWAGPVDNLCRALRRVLALAPEVIVPGHGPLATQKDVHDLLAYWEFLQESLYPLARSGMSSVEAATTVAHSQAFRDKPFSSWDSPERIVTNARNLYREWHIKEPTLPGALQSMNLFRQQSQLAFELSDASPAGMRHLT